MGPRLTEVVGVVCNDENVSDCASGLCDLVGLRKGGNSKGFENLPQMMF